MIPDCAPTARRALGRHAAWPGVYRRSSTGLAARRSGAVPCRLASSYRHSATGLMARNKGQREIKLTLAFCVAKNSSHTDVFHPQGVSLPHADCGKRTSAHLSTLQNLPATSKHPNPQGVNLPTADCGKRKSASLSAPQNFPATPKHPNPQGGKYDRRPLRRSRAAIGSGGKKARPFWRRKKASSERARL